MRGGGAQLHAFLFLAIWVPMPAPRVGKSQGGVLVVWERGWSQGQAPLLAPCLEATWTGEESGVCGQCAQGRPLCALRYWRSRQLPGVQGQRGVGGGRVPG